MAKMPDPTDELKEALQKQRSGYAEKDIFEALSKVFEIEPGILRRLFLAFWRVQTQKGTQLVYIDTPVKRNRAIPDWAYSLATENVEIIEAIFLAVDESMARLKYAGAMLSAQTIDMDVGLLIPPKDMNRICDGCPDRIDCMANNLHKPSECYHQLKRWLPVFPLRMTRDTVTVEAKQPIGTYTIPLKKIRPRE